MTDPEMAHHIYIEPITVNSIERIVAKDRPQAVLATIGGQTALNTAVEAAEKGIFDRFGVEMIGADLEAIKKAEDRNSFKEAMNDIGLEVPGSQIARKHAVSRIDRSEYGFSVVIRPSFTLGGTGGCVGVQY